MVRTAESRRAPLVAALGFALLEHRTRELDVLHAWLDSWSGLGTIVVGMRRHGSDLWLNSDENGWRATFLHAATAGSRRSVAASESRITRLVRVVGARSGKGSANADGPRAEP